MASGGDDFGGRAIALSSKSATSFSFKAGSEAGKVASEDNSGKAGAV